MDTHRHALTRDGVPIDLSPRYVQILAHLLSHPGKVIAKNALLDTVWADVFVTENNLEQAIGAIRKAIGDEAAAQRLIQTVKRKGYRFVGAVDASGAPPQRDAFDDSMKGRLSLESLNAGQLHDATAAFERVLAQDDTYVPAHTALANAYFLQYEVTRPENTPKRSLLERATTHARQGMPAGFIVRRGVGHGKFSADQRRLRGGGACRGPTRDGAAAGELAALVVFEACGDLSGWSRRLQEFDDRGRIPAGAYEALRAPDAIARWEQSWTNTAYTKEKLPILRANLKRLSDAGIAIAAGTDTGVPGVVLGVASQIELLLHVEAGLSSAAALQAATIATAQRLAPASSLYSSHPDTMPTSSCSTPIRSPTSATCGESRAS